MASIKTSPQEPSASAPARPSGFSKDSIYLIRTTVQANLALSQMADQKASILMGATFVVFTLALGQSSHGQISSPLIILALFSFLSAVCAVAVVMPAVRPSKQPDGEQNILFFSVFSQMTEDEFADRILSELQSDERLFRMMLRDIHQNGSVLQRKKYRFLGYAYRLFLIGLTLTFVAFLAGNAVLLFHSAAL